MTSTVSVGIDFGTTNSALALSLPNGDIRLASFQTPEGQATHLFRSVIYFSFEKRDSWGRAQTYAGPQAIAAYLEEDGNGRLLISPKSSLCSTLFESTQVLTTRYTHEDLVAIILRNLKRSAEAEFGELPKRIVAGRPVRFAGAESDEDEQLALKRLRAAYEQVGFEHVSFEYEPVAAAASYEATLEHDELVLVGDFGGGTTDFCVMRMGPSLQTQKRQERILATHGVGIAGDNFDSRIVEHLIAPKFGRDSQYRSGGSRTLPVPVWPYTHLSRWYTVAFLSEKRTINMLRDVHRSALEPDKLQAFLDFIEGNLGLQLYRAVEGSKVELSSQRTSQLHFRELTQPLALDVERKNFEDWIDEDITQIDECCSETLTKAGLQATDIDRIFLTGGTSFVPSVRHLFIERFGEEKLGSGDELTSVASGLARRARERQLEGEL